jgi:hypothetical protein
MIQNNELNGANLNLVNAGTVATAAAATLATTTATVACVNGAFATALASGAGKALSLVGPDGVTAKAATALAIGQACIIVNCVNAAGQMKNVQGPVQALDAANNLVNPVHFPRIPDNLTPFSYLVVKAGSTSSGFTPGTTNWNATGIVTTVQDIVTMPPRPVFS